MDLGTEPDRHVLPLEPAGHLPLGFQPNRTQTRGPSRPPRPSRVIGRAHRAGGYHRVMTDTIDDPRVIDPDAPQYNATLVRRGDQHESLAYFWVRMDGDATPFEAGQYMTIGLMVDGRIVQRPYSIASAPRNAADGYEMYVRLVDGGTFTP